MKIRQIINFAFTILLLTVTFLFLRSNNLPNEQEKVVFVEYRDETWRVWRSQVHGLTVPEWDTFRTFSGYKLATDYAIQLASDCYKIQAIEE